MGIKPDTQGELTPEQEAKVRAHHSAYFEVLGGGDLNALAEVFTFPAVLKGFLEDVVVATDATSLAAHYEALIAAAPKATRTEAREVTVALVRPNVYMATFAYAQFDANDQLVHTGKAIYFMKEVDGAMKLFAVF